jgi:Na+/H+ antiporter NhaD/arsenite permease-like protein
VDFPHLVYNLKIMRRIRISRSRSWFLILVALLAGFFFQTGFAKTDPRFADVKTITVIGRILDTQDVPVDQAEIRIFIAGVQQDLIDHGESAPYVLTDDQGSFVAEFELDPLDFEQDAVALEISKQGFLTSRQGFAYDRVVDVDNAHVISISDVVLSRVFNPAFFLATGFFVVVFGIISLNLLHETIATFLGVAAIFGVSYFIGSFNADYWIIGFRQAIEYIDFDVIFLLLTMMIFMAVMAQTGVFQWLAYRTFQLSRGKPIVVAIVLVAITALFSSVLNDTTVMLLMTPVSIQIAVALDIHPAAIVVPEVLASNIGGAATLIGTPPNTIIGSYVGLSFNQFLINMLPIALLGMVVLALMIPWLYRSEFNRARDHSSEVLLARLEEGARITDPDLLRKSLIIFGVTLILFFLEDLFHMPPAVVAILGSTALLLWSRPTMGEMLREVDWTTLVFFMSLFMMVGAIQEVGLIQLIAEGVSEIAAGNLLLAAIAIIWVSAGASAIVANIPFTAAFVPVAVFLSQSLPGGSSNVLYWALALGAGLGGNATYIGSAPNIVAAGILDRAGYRISFKDFSRVGVPVTFLTILVLTFWIIIRYFWIGF